MRNQLIAVAGTTVAIAVAMVTLAVFQVGGMALPGDRPQAAPTPTRVTAIFFDGATNGDFRQTCRVWLAGRTHQKQCVAYLATLTATAGLGDYRVLPHSYKGWREGQTKVASVRVYNAGDSQVLTARLVKTRKHGWLVVAVSS